MRPHDFLRFAAYAIYLQEDAMNTAETVLLILMLLFSIISFVISYFQFKERGFLFNNSYIYASETERRRMNKTHYYRQSAITFCAVGLMFIMIALEIFTDWKWLFPATIIFAILLILFAIISSVIIARKQK